MEVLKNFWKEEEAIGVVEIIFDPCDPGGTGFDLQDKDNKRCNQCI